MNEGRLNVTITYYVLLLTCYLYRITVTRIIFQELYLFTIMLKHETPRICTIILISRIYFSRTSVRDKNLLYDILFIAIELGYVWWCWTLWQIEATWLYNWHDCYQALIIIIEICHVNSYVIDCGIQPTIYMGFRGYVEHSCGQ